jgi:rhodanese-related sulfurtransferase
MVWQLATKSDICSGIIGSGKDHTQAMEHSEGFLKLVNSVRGNVKEISVADTQKRKSEDSQVKLIDVREDYEWKDGHAAGAIHLGRGIMERDIEKIVPDKSTELILYCGGGYRSALAADSLQRMGYNNVFSMAGGWKAWKAADGKIEQD